MSHNSATGYISNGLLHGASDLGSQALSSYSKTQTGDVYEQLQDGARALDLRPKLLANGTMIFHHGNLGIPISFRRLVLDAIRWLVFFNVHLVVYFWL